MTDPHNHQANPMAAWHPTGYYRRRRVRVTMIVSGDPVVLRTPRLILRQITESDGTGLFDILSDSQATEHYA